MIYVIEKKDIKDWIEICNESCKKFGWELLFVTEYGFGAKTKDEKLVHISVEDLYHILGIDGEEFVKEE